MEFKESILSVNEYKTNFEIKISHNKTKVLQTLDENINTHSIP